MIVVDASCLLELLLQRPASTEIAGFLSEGGAELSAPSLLDVEVCHVLRRLNLIGQLSAARGLEAIEDLREFPIERYPHTVLVDRMWKLGNNLTAYDAAYIALAEALDAPIITCDQKLAASTGHRARIEAIS